MKAVTVLLFYTRNLHEKQAKQSYMENHVKIFLSLKHKSQMKFRMIIPLYLIRTTRIYKYIHTCAHIWDIYMYI
jgi:hypothetical protein